MAVMDCHTGGWFGTLMTVAGRRALVVLVVPMLMVLRLNPPPPYLGPPQN